MEKRSFLMTDTFNLRHFLVAQDAIYSDVLKELRAGHKQSHWMWFVFPQIQGLGHSPMAQRYAITSAQEASTYEAHPLLGPRLRECTQLVLNIPGRQVEYIFPYPDHLKFRSCMTLFAHCATDNQLFREALLQYFNNEADPATLQILKTQRDRESEH
jgi:uncharacterized protein (DUF1810 family)